MVQQLHPAGLQPRALVSVTERVLERWKSLRRHQRIGERNEATPPQALQDGFADLVSRFAIEGRARQVVGESLVVPQRRTVARDERAQLSIPTPSDSAIETTSCAHGPQSAAIAP